MPASKSPSGRSRRGSSKTAREDRSETAREERSETAEEERSENAEEEPSETAGEERSETAREKSNARGAEASAPVNGLTSFTEQLADHVIKPFGLVMLTRERIQDTLDEAASRGRLTRSDANELVAELVQRGRDQTDELLSDLERLFGRGREQLGSAWDEGLERIVRTADLARRTVGATPPFPILGYGELTAAQVDARLHGLTAAELRRVREYERRHANRKSVLEAIERALR